MQPYLIAVMVLLFVFVVAPSAATACPMCKAALAGDHDRMVQAWGASIVFLLSMPFLLVTSFSTYMYVLVRRARREEAARRAASHARQGSQQAEDDPITRHETVGV